LCRRLCGPMGRGRGSHRHQHRRRRWQHRRRSTGRIHSRRSTNCTNGALQQAELPKVAYQKWPTKSGLPKVSCSATKGAGSTGRVCGICHGANAQSSCWRSRLLYRSTAPAPREGDSAEVPSGKIHKLQGNWRLLVGPRPPEVMHSAPTGSEPAEPRRSHQATPPGPCLQAPLVQRSRRPPGQCVLLFQPLVSGSSNLRFYQRLFR
jgi:hypothetical protein